MRWTGGWSGIPSFAYQTPALERWRASLEVDPAEVSSYLVPGDEIGARVSRPPGTDVVISWQAVDWSLARNAPDRRIVYTRSCRGLDEVEG